MEEMKWDKFKGLQKDIKFEVEMRKVSLGVEEREDSQSYVDVVKEEWIKREHFMGTMKIRKWRSME